MTGPVAMASAAPASAVGCSSFYYGSDINHNESVGRDRRRVRKALAGLALAAAMTGPVAVASATPASAEGCSSCYYGQDINHNESTLTDRR